MFLSEGTLIFRNKRLIGGGPAPLNGAPGAH